MNIEQQAVLAIYIVCCVLSACFFWKEVLRDAIRDDLAWRDRNPEEYAQSDYRRATLGRLLAYLGLSCVPIINLGFAIPFTCSFFSKQLAWLWNLPLVPPRRK